MFNRFEIVCKFGQGALDATTQDEAVIEALAYGAKHGIRVTLLRRDAVGTVAIGRIPPTWTAGNVGHLLFSDATPGCPTRAN